MPHPEREPMVRGKRGAVRPRVVLSLLAALLAFAPSRPFAHEVPASVTVLAFVAPEGQRLRLAVRIPLEAIRDVNFPLRGPGYLDVARAQPLLADAARLWIANYVELYEGEKRLAGAHVASTRIAPPSDRAFAEYTMALTHLHESPQADVGDLVWQQASLDVLFEYPIASASSRFSIRPALAHLGVRTSTVLRFRSPDGSERAFRYDGDPGIVRLDPRWHQATMLFVRQGFGHILGGLDHLLFLLLLILPFRRMRPLIAIVTSFTIAHSITLIASAMGAVPGNAWFPPLIEVLIVLSILFMALENIVGARLERRWIIAFVFGLAHGFGFSFALRDSLQFAGGHLLSSLLAFNVGVELGQILVIVLSIPLLELLFRRVVAERIGTAIVSALVAHTASHWITERGAVLGQYRLQWPVLDLAFLAAAMRFAIIVLLLGSTLWVLSWLLRRLVTPSNREHDAEGTTASVKG